MNTDLYKTAFLEKLISRKNYDLFSSDIHENLHWGKLFVHLSRSSERIRKRRHL